MMNCEQVLESVRKQGINLSSVRNQTREICLEAVKHDGWALRFVKEQTLEVCREALKESIGALQFVKDIEHVEILSKEFDILYLPINNPYKLESLMISNGKCWLGFNEGITVEALIEYIYKCDGGLEKHPERQVYLDFLKENGLIQ